MTNRKFTTMRTALPLSVLFVSLLSVIPAAARDVSNAGVTVANAWARATPGGVSNGAAYLEIKTAAGVSDRLVSAASPAAGKVELHTHTMDGDVMRMRRVDAIVVKQDAPVVLKPHGDHIMLMDLKAPLKAGDLIKLTLTFEKAGPLEVEAAVEPVGAMGPRSADTQPAAAPAMDHGAHKH